MILRSPFWIYGKRPEKRKGGRKKEEEKRKERKKEGMQEPALRT